MNVQPILELADELISDYTGEGLDYWQKIILEGTLNSKTYSTIAEETYSSESHVRSVGAKLWKMLSEILDERITKTNLKAILESANIYIASMGRDNVTNNINFCSSKLHPSPNPHQQKTPIQTIIDLDKAPQITNFYDRDEELSILSQWVAGDRLRLISLVGLSGIGKTTLSLRLIEEIKTHFNCIIYRSLRFSPCLKTTLTNLLETLSPDTKASQEIETLINQIFQKLQKTRCFIVLDDLHQLFKKGKQAGKYASGYEDYRQFFQLLASSSHSSCSLLISREKLREMEKVENDNYPGRSLLLSSLGEGAKEILQKHGLKDKKSWQKLIDNYQGNPRWLEIVAATIQDLFGGKVGEFIEYETLILPEALQGELEQEFERLSPVEREIIQLIARENGATTFPKLLGKLQLSASEVVNAIQSLKMRLLLEGIQQDNSTLLVLNPLWQQYGLVAE
ncbi:MAG: ATP-binding protein [Cyanobacteriota bacterium]|nr:ATP-binding protein [Cyanobacteriota bacterium]